MAVEKVQGQTWLCIHCSRRPLLRTIAFDSAAGIRFRPKFGMNGTGVGLTETTITASHRQDDWTGHLAQRGGQKRIPILGEVVDQAGIRAFLGVLELGLHAVDED